jgi:hypothetical protein
LEKFQALVDILGGILGVIDVVAQEDDALAADAFVSCDNGGIEDYGVMEVKSLFFGVHRSLVVP